MTSNPKLSPADRAHPATRLVKAMFALWDELKRRGYPFETWPDAVKDSVSAAIIDPTPPSEAELEWARSRTQQLIDEGLIKL